MTPREHLQAKCISLKKANHVSPNGKSPSNTLTYYMYRHKHTCSLIESVNSIPANTCGRKSEFPPVYPPPNLRGFTDLKTHIIPAESGSVPPGETKPQNQPLSDTRTHHLNAGRCSPERCSAVPQALSFPRASCCGRAELVSVRFGRGVSAARSSVLTLALSRTDGEAHCNCALWLLGAHWATAAEPHPAACPERQDACVSAVGCSPLKIIMSTQLNTFNVHVVNEICNNKNKHVHFM